MARLFDAQLVSRHAEIPRGRRSTLMHDPAGENTSAHHRQYRIDDDLLAVDLNAGPRNVQRFAQAWDRQPRAANTGLRRDAWPGPGPRAAGEAKSERSDSLSLHGTFAKDPQGAPKMHQPSQVHSAGGKRQLVRRMHRHWPPGVLGIKMPQTSFNNHFNSGSERNLRGR